MSCPACGNSTVVARTAVPELIAEVRQLQARLEAQFTETERLRQEMHDHADAMTQIAAAYDDQHKLAKVGAADPVGLVEELVESLYDKAESLRNWTLPPKC